MSKFTTPLKVEQLDNAKEWRLVEEFEYYRENDKNDIIKVPAGFVTDFASIPHIFWWILPPTGTKRNPVGKPSVLHDFLYDKKCPYNYTRKEADDIFLEAMCAVKVNRFVRWLLYNSVRWFGKSRFKK